MYEHDDPIYRKDLSKAGVALESVRHLVFIFCHDDHAAFLNELTHDATIANTAHKQSDALLKTGKNDQTRSGVISTTLSSLSRDKELYTSGQCVDHIVIILDSSEAFCDDA